MLMLDEVDAEKKDEKRPPLSAGRRAREQKRG